jgi:hypothetical protein
MGVWKDNPDARKPYLGPGDLQIRFLPGFRKKQNGSASRSRQDLMKDGMSADKYIKAVVAANPGNPKAENLARIDLNYDVVSGFIEFFYQRPIITQHAPLR